MHFSPQRKLNNLYLGHKVTYPGKALWCTTHRNPGDQKSFTFKVKNARNRSIEIVFKKDFR
jgi:hypothetical protein